MKTETATKIEQMSAESRQAFELAFGRILRMGARPAQPGDIEEYNRCRAVCFDAVEGVLDLTPDYAPNYIRDCSKGAR